MTFTNMEAVAMIDQGEQARPVEDQSTGDIELTLLERLWERLPWQLMLLTWKRIHGGRIVKDGKDIT